MTSEQLDALTARNSALVEELARAHRRDEQRERSLETMQRELLFKTTRINQLTDELAQYKRLRFGKSNGKLDASQVSLLEETTDEDLAAIEAELGRLGSRPKSEPRSQPRRGALDERLPRVDVHHEPASTTCRCGSALKRIGEEVTEKLDYGPGVFRVERHVRGKWAWDPHRTSNERADGFGQGLQFQRHRRCAGQCGRCVQTGQMRRRIGRGMLSQGQLGSGQRPVRDGWHGCSRDGRQLGTHSGRRNGRSSLWHCSAGFRGQVDREHGRDQLLHDQA